MKHLFDRLERLRVVLSGLVLTGFGIGLLAIERALSPEGWIRHVPLNELGGILVGAGLLGIWLDHLFRSEQREAEEFRLRQILHDHAPIMRDAVLDAFAANHNDLKRVATSETLDRLISNSLALRLDDQSFAEDIFTDLKTQAIDSAERWVDASLSIDISPMSGADAQADYLDITVRWEYTTTPAHPTRRFVCLSDKTEYAELAKTGTNTSAWYLAPDDRFDARDRRAYELLKFSVDGTQRAIRRSTRASHQNYDVDIGTEVIERGSPVRISYSYRVVSPISAGLVFFDVEQPTKDLDIRLDWSTEVLSKVSSIDMFAATSKVIREQSSQADRATLRLEIDGWTFPRAGVVFVWARR